jgi:SAM-dependent methyltransferase
VSSVDPHWYESFFETDEWLLLATTRDEERTEREVSFLAEHLPSGGRVLDLACGTGRIAAPLARRGLTVAGLDISAAALEIARAAAPALDLRRGDMRQLPWEDASFDAVINMWTAFGYFETEAEDRRVVAEIARVLEPGGLFVLDTVNLTAMHRSFAPESWRELADGTLMLERRSYDATTGRGQAFWTFVRADGERRVLSFDHRLYSAAEYVSLLRAEGLEPERFFGGFDGSELTLDSWRLIVLARRR